MTRYERRAFFDRLYGLREAYRTLAADDRTATISIADVIDWAEAKLAAMPAGTETGDVDGATPSGHREIGA